MTLLLPILLLCATLGIAPALPCASMTSYVNSGGWTAFHNICTAANTCFFLPLCEDGFYRPAAEFGFCKGGEIMRQPECRTPCHAGDKSDRFSASSAAWHMLFPLYPQRTTDSDSCHFVPVCKDSGADAVTGVSSDGVFTVEPQCSPAPSPAPSPSPTPSPNADCTNDDSWEGFAFGNTMYSCSSFDPADRFPSSCLELIRHVGDPLEDDLREHCPKACDPALCPFSVDGYATAGDLVQILPSTSHIEGYGGVCECGDLFGEKTRYEVGSILWSNGPQQVMCYGGTVISSFTENSQSRANKRVICQFHEIPAEIQVTSSNVCYLDSPTSAQYPSTVNLRNASLAGNDLPPAFAWSSPYYQFAYFTNTWHHDCAGHEVFGGVLGSPTVEGAANTKDLDLFYQCQRGQPVAAGKVVPDSGVFGKYRIERKQCSDLHDDTASTDLLKNLREQYQPSDCGDCGPRGMVNFMVLSATLHCTMTGDDLIVDANGESYTCVGDGGEGWRNGFGSTHKGNGVEMVVCTDKYVKRATMNERGRAREGRKRVLWWGLASRALCGFLCCAIRPRSHMCCPLA